MEKPSKAGLRDETERIKGSQSWSEGRIDGKYSAEEGGRKRWNRPNGCNSSSRSRSSGSSGDCQREGRKQKFENRRRALQWDGHAGLEGGGARRRPEDSAVWWAMESRASRLTGATTWVGVGFSVLRRPWSGGKKKAALSVTTQGRDGRSRDED